MSEFSLADLARRRDGVLAHTSALLEEDDRVVAAWLSGSFGRSEADEWSDLDLHVAVRDATYEAILHEPGAVFALAGEPLLVQGNFESDSMPGGRFWLVVYEGPVEIDWNVGPASLAVRPEQSALLFERSHIPIAPTPAAVPLKDVRQTAQGALEFFWAMAPIALKYAGRGHTRNAVTQIGLLEKAYARLWQAVHRPERLLIDASHQNRRVDPELDARLPRLLTTITPTSAVDVIEQFCELAAELHAELRTLGVRTPDRLRGEVAQLSALARTEASAGGSSPHTGSRR